MTLHPDAQQSPKEETEERFRALLENSPSGILLIDATARVLYVGPSDERILGRKQEEALESSALEWVHPEDLEYSRSLLSRILESAKQTLRYELRALHKDGTWRWVECSARNLLDDPRIGGIVINYQDITQRKKQEEEARLQRERFELLTRATRDVVWDWNLENGELWWNNEFYYQFGYGNETPPDLDFWSKRIHPDDSTHVWESLNELFKSEKVHWQAEYSFLHANGSFRRVLDRGFVIRNEAGKPVRMLGTLMDISARNAAELKMTKLAAFAQFNPNPVFEFSADGELTYFNDAALRLTHSAAKEHPAQILPSDVGNVVRECLETGRPKLEPRTTINARAISWWFFPVQSCKVVHCYAADVTERIHLEEQLRHSTKMEVVGQLAGGIAHDFNNLLTVIQGHATMLGLNASLPPRATESAREIQLAAERAGNLTRQLLTFSRKQVMQERKLDCNDVVRNITRMLQRLLGENIDLQVAYSARPPIVVADAG
ncbi:MAG: PAS domain S-box protein, partial [Limisphaerales bacterium]